MTGALLEARDVTVRFGRGPESIDAVRGASVAIARSEIVGIVGESGSGKSTIARVLVGLQIPTAGDVLFDGRVQRAGGRDGFLPGRQRRLIQMVFQDPYGSLNPRMRAVDAVAEAVSHWRGQDGAAARVTALEILRSVGIGPELAEQLPKRLSGGQRQRVSVARAIAPEPEVLIADEPTSSIDQSAQAQLLNLLTTLQQDRGLAVVFISHDLSLIRYVTSRTYVMHEGSVVEHGPTEDVFASPKEAYTKRLIAAIPGQRKRE